MTDVRPVRFLYLGRIVPWKGCHLLIEAFGALQKAVPPDAATLDLVGATSYWDGSYRTELEVLVKKLALEAFVSIEGNTDDPYGLLARHHVLCMPSTDEPFGRAAAEAQGCGLPVIGFAGGGLPEIVVDGETGVLVPEGDRQAFTDAMAEFIGNPGLIATMGKKGYRRVRHYFNRTVQVPAIVDYMMERVAAM